MSTRIGIIGVGRMGSRMAVNLLEAGYEVVVFDVDPDSVERLEERGADGAESVADIASDAETILTSLPDSPTAEAVYLGEDGLETYAEDGTTLLEMSTLRPETIDTIDEALAGRDLAFVDAPVIGPPTEAAAGTLTIVVGCSTETFDEVEPLLDVLGNQVTHVGAPGVAQRIKLANNVMTYGNFAIAAEMMAVVDQLGIDPELFYEITQSGVASASIVQAKAPKAFEGDFEPGFTFAGLLKDLRYALDMKTDTKVPTPVAATVTEQYVLGSGVAGSDVDYAALIGVLSDLRE